MKPYELMIKTHHYLIKGGLFTESQKQNIVKQLLSAVSTNETAHRFYNGVKYPNNADCVSNDREGRQMYPVFYNTNT